MQPILPMHAYGATLKYLKGAIIIVMYNNNPTYHRSDTTKTIHHYTKRTMEALLETDEDALKTEDCTQKRKGRINDPLIHWIPDELHLMLRITDVLTRNLINAAANQDKKDGRRSKNINDRSMIQKLIESIRSCGVPFKIHNADKKAFSFTSLVGGDKLKLLAKMPKKIKRCQPVNIADTFMKLWKVSASKIVEQTFIM